MSAPEVDDPLVLAQRSTHTSNDRSLLTEEQLTKAHGWKTQPGMAQIKLEYVALRRWEYRISIHTLSLSLLRRYIDFDHEVRISLEHLSETDKKAMNEPTDASNPTEEPKKKKFKVRRTTAVHRQAIDELGARVKIESISKSTHEHRATPTIISYASSSCAAV